MVKEDICQFSEEYLVGNELIDNEHKELFRLIGKANTMVREEIDASRCDEVMDILAELKEYTEFHFSDEEEYMESIHYEGLEAQKRAHTAFVYKITNIKKEEIEKQYALPLLARIPFDGEMTSLIDEGKVEYINKDYVDELVYKIEEKLKEKE